ncbi:unnamed protein product [Trichogramma brassicae]|uniref:Uncharacterized protein n=1 Tax=Trichogramma brassicae TaxID=86971 RepID=A0A6H5J5N4_9HYME|nr:unnamed protein product [Trichogramma brassicae]
MRREIATQEPYKHTYTHANDHILTRDVNDSKRPLQRDIVKSHTAPNCTNEHERRRSADRHSKPAVDQQPSLRSGHKCRRALPLHDFCNS